MTTLIASGMTLRLGSGAIIQGGSVQAPPAYVAFSDNGTNKVARYAGDGTTTPVWETTLSDHGTALGVDVTNQKIFAADSNDILTKIDAATGAVDWTVDVGDIVDGPRIAVDENGHAYVAFRGSSDALATKKINGSNANTIWSSSTTYDAGRSTIYSQAQNAVYVCHQDGHNAGLIKYNASTGVEIWKKNSSDTLVSSAGAPANPIDGVLLPDGNIALATSGWTGSQNRGHLFVLNASTGAQIVKQNLVAPHSGGSIVADSTHVFMSTSGAGGAYFYAWEHDGTNLVTNTSITSIRSMGYRESKDQAYLADSVNGDLLPMNATSTSINFGASIGNDGRNGGSWPILFLD